MLNEFENHDEELNEETAEEDDLGTIELVDENGDSQVFELLATFDLNGCHYLAVADPIEEDDPESVEVVILKTETDEEGNDTYVTVEDEESDMAFNHFLSLVDAEAAQE